MVSPELIGSPKARELVEKGIEKCDFKMFGEGLHALQDSYSHRGKHSFGKFGGHGTGKFSWTSVTKTIINYLDSGKFTWQQMEIELKGIFAGISSSADNVKDNKSFFFDTARATFEYMVKFAEKCGKCKCPNGQMIFPPGKKPPTEGDFETWLADYYKGKYE